MKLPKLDFVKNVNPNLSYFYSSLTIDDKVIFGCERGIAEYSLSSFKNNHTYKTKSNVNCILNIKKKILMLGEG